MTFVGINEKIYFDDNLNVGIGITNPSTNFHIDSTDGIVIPVGTTAQRVDVTGAIRYNTDISTFEGFKGTWGSLGGVIDVDQDTYVSAETSAGTDNDQLKFVTAGTERMVIDSSGNTTINSDLIVDTNLLFVDASSDLVNINGTLDVWGKFHVDSNAIYAENSIIALGNTLTGPIIDSQGTNIRLTPNSSYIGALTIDASGDTSLTGNLSMNDNNIININNIDFSSATIKGHMIPDTDDAYDIGSAEFKIRELYVSDNSLWVGDAHKVSITSTGKMKFRKRKVSSVPAAVAAADGTENGAKSHSGMGSLADMKLKHWRAYMRTLPGQGSARIQDIFRDNDDDYDEQASADNWLENGTKTFCNLGNVGIGTDDPDYKLDVNGSVQLLSDKAVVFDSGGFGNGHSTDLYFNKGDVGFNQSEFVMYNQNDSNASNRYFAMAYSTAGNETGLNINIANNVGIGTTSPSYKLSVVNSSGTGTMEIRSGGESHDTILYLGTPFSITAKNKAAIIAEGADFYSLNDLHFCLNNDTDNNTEVDLSDAKMTILRDGNVGIGTNNPSKLLEIHDSVYSTSLKIVQSNSSLRAGMTLRHDNAGDMNIQLAHNGTLIQQNYAGGDFTWYNTTAELMRLENGGNVGIGTTDPTTILNINTGSTVGGNTKNCAIKFNNYDAGARFVVWDNGTSVNDYAGLGKTFSALDICIPLSSNHFAFKAAGTELMRINGYGNVGIGTSPDEKFHIKSNSTAYDANVPAIKITTHNLFNSVYGGSFNLLQVYCAAVSHVEMNLINYNQTGTGQYDITSRTKTGLGFSTRNNTTLNVNALAIDYRGYVGIGDSTPSYQLELSTNSAAKPSSTAWNTTSDERLKENIVEADLELCYDDIKNLQLRKFKWIDTYVDVHSLTDINRLGFIAQEVELINPKSITTIIGHNEKYDLEDVKSLNVDQLNMSLFGAVKKLIEKNEALETQIVDILARVEALEN